LIGSEAAAAPDAGSPDLASVRDREFPAVRGACFLNAASVTPLPERARAALREYDARRAAVHTMRGADFEPTLAACREAAARLVGADAGEIALGGNTSFGVNLAALSLPVQPGRAVVLSDREFPANVYPWMARQRDGWRVDIVPTDAAGNPDEERLLERLDQDDVAVFALSAVQFATGYRADLERFGSFCRSRGIFFVVDAIQALGHLPIDVRAMKIDVLATGGHKWLCSPFGTGFAYVRRELIERMEPAVIGWTAMPASDELESLLDYRFEFHADARRWEVATPPYQGFAAMTAALSLLQEVGIERVREHVLALLDPLVGWLRSRQRYALLSDLRTPHRSGILTFRVPDPEATFGELKRAGVVCALREGAIRVAPHLYNCPEEIGRVIDTLERLEPK
jgi:cysteine desulfurase / selenocysteine lyase